jgi:hypothetical protein
MLFLDRRAVGRVRHDHGFAQIFGGLAGVAEDFRLQLFEPVLEESELILIHVILVAHLQDFGFGQESFRRHLACFFNVRQIIARTFVLPAKAPR